MNLVPAGLNQLRELACRVYYTTDGGETVKVFDFAPDKDPFAILERVAKQIFPNSPAAAPAPLRAQAPSAARAPTRAAAAGDGLSQPGGESGGPVRPPASGSPKETTSPTRTGVRDTSRYAYRSLKWSGKLEAQQKKVLDAIAHSGRDDLTRQEIAKATGLGINAVCGRVHKLLHLPEPLLKELPIRTCSVTSENAHPVRLALEQGSLL